MKSVATPKSAETGRELAAAASQARLAAERQRLLHQHFTALNKLAAGTAHEFNNLIAGILGSAELIAMDLPENHPAHETIQHIFEASNRARDFVHKLRELGHRQPPDRKHIRLQPVIEECLQILRGIIPDRVEIQAKLQPGCPPVHADPAQLQQAILEICLQSWQGFAERRGRIKITLETCPPDPDASEAADSLRTGPHLRLTIHDNSPGLEKSARDKIFDPFHLRRATGKKTGLELFLVRETIQAQPGEIFVESEPGKGLTFHICLPVAVEK